MGCIAQRDLPSLGTRGIMTPSGGLGDYGCANPIFSMTLRQRLAGESALLRISSMRQLFIRSGPTRCCGMVLAWSFVFPGLNSAGLALPSATLNRNPAPGLGGPLVPPVFRRGAAAQIVPGRDDWANCVPTLSHPRNTRGLPFSRRWASGSSARRAGELNSRARWARIVIRKRNREFETP